MIQNFEFFFKNIISGMQRFYTRPHVPVKIIKVFRSIFRILRFQINFNFQIFEKSPSQKNQRKRSLFLQYSFPLKTSLIARTSTHLTLKLICSCDSAKSLSDFANILANMFLFGARKNICTAPFLDVQEPALIALVFIFLYISVRKLLFQRRSKVLSDGGGLNYFLKVA